MARLTGWVSMALLLAAVTANGAEIKADGKSLTVTVGEATLTFAPPEIRDFETTVPVPADYNPSFDTWDAWPGGTKDAVRAVSIGPKRDEQNTHVLGPLYRSVLPESVVITSADGSKTFKVNEDYRYYEDHAQIAAIAGRLGTAGRDELKVKLKYATQRLDLIQVDASGKPSVKQGTARMVCPQLPEADAGMTPLAGVYIAPWRRDGAYVIAPEDVYPIKAVEPVRPINPAGTERARKKLAEGGKLSIAFLGDSVTLGAEAGAWWANLWTEKNLSYVSRVIVELRKRHPQATIEPIHAARGATTTTAASAMFDEMIAPTKADVVLIAFGLNDAFGPISRPNNPPEAYKEAIRALIKKSRDMGAEVILVTPMQPNPFMKNRIAERITWYRQALIELANEEQVTCADVHTAWLNQAYAGVPPFSQLHNWNNHPGSEAHAVYADTVLRCFEAQAAATPAQPQAAAAAVSGMLEQPTRIPGKWAYGDGKDMPPLPDLETILKNAKPNPFIYGLYTWASEYKTHRDAIRRVGWRSFRSGGPMTDEAMRFYAEDGVEVMPNVGVSREIRKRLPTDPSAKQALIDDYPSRLEALLSRYGPGGTFFKENPTVPERPLQLVEITNEPNFQYVIPPDGRSQKELEADREALYSKLLPLAFKTVREKWPTVKVIGFSAGGASAGDLRFIANVHKLDPAVASSYDVLATHPYVDPEPPEAFAYRTWGRYSIASSLATIRQTLSEHPTPAGAWTPIWYTEIGWPISKADGGKYETKGDHVTPMLQAAYVCRLYAFSQRLGVERVHVMFTTDTDNFNGGFFLPDGKWRPSAVAVCNMIRLMPSPKLVGAISDGAGGLFAYRFESGDATNSPVVMAWTVSGTKPVRVEVGASEAVVTDMLGNARRVPTTDGAVTIEAGPLPTYVSVAR